MKIETLQEKIEAIARRKATAEYGKFVNFMQTNELCKLLKFKKGDELVPFCDHYNEDPLFETGLENKMEDADLYTNFNEARDQLVKYFINVESNNLLRKIDSISDYFNDNIPNTDPE